MPYQPPEDDRDIAPWEHISVGLGRAIERCATAYMRNFETPAEPPSDPANDEQRDRCA